MQVHDGVKIVQHPQLGATATATRDFSAGAVVIAEWPALVIDKPELRRLEQDGGSVAGRLRAIATDAGISGDFFDALSAVAQGSRDAVRSAVRHLYTPLKGRIPSPSAGFDASPLELAACAAVLDGAVAVFGSSRLTAKDVRALFPSPPELAAFIHGVRVNTHMDEKRGRAGVFPTACKLAHSCAPNTFWFFDTATCSPERPMGKAVHIATRRIARGEHLTFSYVGCGWNLLTFTLERRQMLRHLNFVCHCARCVAFDEGKEQSHAFHCPRCAEASPCRRELDLARRAAANGILPSVGVSLEAVATVDLRLDSNPRGWRCRKCSWLAGPDEIAQGLAIEAVARRAVMAEFFTSRATGPGTAAGLLTKWAVAEKTLMLLGSGHFLTAVAAAGFLRFLCFYLAAVLGRDADGPAHDDAPVPVPLQSAALQRLVVSASLWFERNASHTPQHIRFIGHVTEATGLLQSACAALQDQPSGDQANGALRSLFDGATCADFGSLERLCKRDQAALAPLLSYAEFAPLTMTS